MLKCFVLLMAAWAAMGDAQAAERRVALVVGVAAYSKVPPLANTLNDARGIAAALGRLSFEVDTVLDPDRGAMEAALRRFGAASRGADVALFFYAGHALEFGGRNWLLPTTADVHGERDLRYEAAELDGVLEQLDGAARVSVILLDSCRDNPFRVRLGSGRGIEAGGLAQVRAAVGTLIAFSTAPGTVAADGSGRNSPFTTALLKRIEQPGIEIRQMLAEVRKDVREATGGRQVPWEQSAMEGALYLKAAPSAPVVAPSPAPPSSAAAGRLNADTLFWDSLRNSNRPEELRAYLERFPDGVFVPLARSRLMAMAGQASAGVPAPGFTAPTGLVAQLAAVAGSVSAPVREKDLSAYVADAGSKALALSPDRQGLWRSTAWSTVADAEEDVLEGCQAYYNGPCILLARNSEVVSEVDRVPRDMARVRYNGTFAVAEIPNLPKSRRESPDVMGYAAAPGPKAMAFHPWGRVFTTVAARNQTEAEDKALAACDADPQRAGKDGGCMLYASGISVVLPRRLHRSDIEPYVRISAAVGLASNSFTTNYPTLTGFKALALHVESGRTFSWSGLDTQAQADQLALEGCQQQYVTPCALVASGTTLLASDPRTAPRRDMPRVRYTGAFDVGQVPFLRMSTELTAYAADAGFKAMAVRPNGARLRTVLSAPTAAEAEWRAMAACNADKSAFPCFLYASGNQVVLPERRTEPRR